MGLLAQFESLPLENTLNDGMFTVSYHHPSRIESAYLGK